VRPENLVPSNRARRIFPDECNLIFRVFVLVTKSTSPETSAIFDLYKNCPTNPKHNRLLSTLAAQVTLSTNETRFFFLTEKPQLPLTPPDFERHAGSARKNWRTSIVCVDSDKTLRDELGDVPLQRVQKRG
jgi:hypothetical protein